MDAERKAIMCRIMAYGIGANDARLFLDTHPDNAEALAALNEYITKEEQVKAEYERRYGAISYGTVMPSYRWTEAPWPWEREAN